MKLNITTSQIYKFTRPPHRIHPSNLFTQFLDRGAHRLIRSQGRKCLFIDLKPVLAKLYNLLHQSTIINNGTLSTHWELNISVLLRVPHAAVNNDAQVPSF